MDTPAWISAACAVHNTLSGRRFMAPVERLEAGQSRGRKRETKRNAHRRSR